MLKNKNGAAYARTTDSDYRLQPINRKWCCGGVVVVLIEAHILRMRIIAVTTVAPIQSSDYEDTVYTMNVGDSHYDPLFPLGSSFWVPTVYTKPIYFCTNLFCVLLFGWWCMRFVERLEEVAKLNKESCTLEKRLGRMMSEKGWRRLASPKKARIV